MIKRSVHLGFSEFLKHVLSLTKLLGSKLVKNTGKQGSVSFVLNSSYVHRQVPKKHNLQVSRKVPLADWEERFVPNINH